MPGTCLPGQAWFLQYVSNRSFLGFALYHPCSHLLQLQNCSTNSTEPAVGFCTLARIHVHWYHGSLPQESALWPWRSPTISQVALTLLSKICGILYWYCFLLNVTPQILQLWHLVGIYYLVCTKPAGLALFLTHLQLCSSLLQAAMCCCFALELCFLFWAYIYQWM